MPILSFKQLWRRHFQAEILTSKIFHTTHSTRCWAPTSLQLPSDSAHHRPRLARRIHRLQRVTNSPTRQPQKLTLEQRKCRKLEWSSASNLSQEKTNSMFKSHKRRLRESRFRNCWAKCRLCKEKTINLSKKVSCKKWLASKEHRDWQKSPLASSDSVGSVEPSCWRKEWPFNRKKESALQKSSHSLRQRQQRQVCPYFRCYLHSRSSTWSRISLAKSVQTVPNQSSTRDRSIADGSNGSTRPFRTARHTMLSCTFWSMELKISVSLTSP